MVDQNNPPLNDPEDETRSGAHGKLTPLSPSEAYARIQEGKVLENVIIERMTFKGEFSNPVKMKNCHLVRPKFDSAIFKADVSMTNCTIERPHFNRETVFHGDWVLQASTLIGTMIAGVTVKGFFNLPFAQTRGQFNIVKCRFEGKVSFWDVTYNGWVNIRDTTFVGEADFRSGHAQKGISFLGCRFESDALYRGLAMTLKFDMSNCHCEKMLDLSRAKFNDYAYLETITQGPQMQFAFENTIGDRVRVRTEQLNGRIKSEQAGNYDQAMHEYAFLKRSFGALHRYDEEDWAFYRFKVNQRRSKKRTWARPWSKMAQFFDWLLLDVGCGYGANPLRAVRAAAIIIITFALIYMIGIDYFYIAPEKLPFPDPSNEHAVRTLPNRIMIGMTLSVGVFTSGVGGIKELAQGWMNVPLVIEAIMGMLLWGLFIVSFSRKVIR